MNKKYKAHFDIKKFATVFLCFAFIIGYAQNTRYRFDNLTNEQGLADRIVNVIIQDAQGYMWMGSQLEGLTKYDGYSCTVYTHRPSDNYSLSDNAVSALCLDDDGFLWVGTHKGLNRYDAQNNRFDVFLHNANEANSICSNEIVSQDCALINSTRLA